MRDRELLDPAAEAEVAALLDELATDDPQRSPAVSMPAVRIGAVGP
jgi:hypothetical protein